jgi:hypothetical protein
MVLTLSSDGIGGPSVFKCCRQETLNKSLHELDSKKINKRWKWKNFKFFEKRFSVIIVFQSSNCSYCDFLFFVQFILKLLTANGPYRYGIDKMTMN